MDMIIDNGMVSLSYYLNNEDTQIHKYYYHIFMII